MIKKILITGSTGFVGSSLVPKLLKEGHEVLEITRDLAKSKKLFKDATLQLEVSDVNFKIKVAEFNPDVVVHLASYLTSSDNWSDVEKLIESNILFLSKILDSIANLDLQLFINTGTFAEYFKGDNEFLPAYFYAATKTASRAIIDYYANAFNFKQTTVVPYTIYGGGEQKKIIDFIYDSTFVNKPFNLSPGEQVLDFIHIDDVTDFYCTVINMADVLSDKINFKLGTGVGHNLKQIAIYIEDVTNRKTNINWGGNPYRKSDVMYAVADVIALKSELNWMPKTPLLEGIKKMYL